MDDIVPLEGEHDQNGEEKENEGEGAYEGHKFFLIPSFTHSLQADKSCEQAGDEGNTQIDEDRLSDLPHGNVHNGSFHSQPAGQDSNKKVGVPGKEKDLEDGIKSHQTGTVFPVAFCKIIPDDDHCDAAGKADEDEPHHVIVMAGKEGRSQSEHEDRPDNPVLN